MSQIRSHGGRPLEMESTFIRASRNEKSLRTSVAIDEFEGLDLLARGVCSFSWPTPAGSASISESGKPDCLLCGVDRAVPKLWKDL